MGSHSGKSTLSRKLMLGGFMATILGQEPNPSRHLGGGLRGSSGHKGPPYSRHQENARRQAQIQKGMLSITRERS